MQLKIRISIVTTSVFILFCFGPICFAKKRSSKSLLNVELSSFKPRLNKVVQILAASKNDQRFILWAENEIIKKLKNMRSNAKLTNLNDNKLVEFLDSVEKYVSLDSSYNIAARVQGPSDPAGTLRYAVKLVNSGKLHLFVNNFKYIEPVLFKLESQKRDKVVSFYCKAARLTGKYEGCPTLIAKYPSNSILIKQAQFHNAMMIGDHKTAQDIFTRFIADKKSKCSSSGIFYWMNYYASRMYLVQGNLSKSLICLEVFGSKMVQSLDRFYYLLTKHQLSLLEKLSSPPKKSTKYTSHSFKISEALSKSFDSILVNFDIQIERWKLAHLEGNSSLKAQVYGELDKMLKDTQLKPLKDLVLVLKGKLKTSQASKSIMLDELKLFLSKVEKNK